MRLLYTPIQLKPLKWFFGLHQGIICWTTHQIEIHSVLAQCQSLMLAIDLNRFLYDPCVRNLNQNHTHEFWIQLDKWVKMCCMMNFPCIHAACYWATKLDVNVASLCLRVVGGLLKWQKWKGGRNNTHHTHTASEKNGGVRTSKKHIATDIFSLLRVHG